MSISLLAEIMYLIFECVVRGSSKKKKNLKKKNKHINNESREYGIQPTFNVLPGSDSVEDVNSSRSIVQACEIKTQNEMHCKKKKKMHLSTNKSTTCESKPKKLVRHSSCF